MVLDKVLSIGEGRKVKKLDDVVKLVATYEPELEDLSDDELRGKTPEFRQRFENGETLDDLLPEAFAVVREGGRRTIGQRPFDVQVLGGIVLHKGDIAEVKTRE